MFNKGVPSIYKHQPNQLVEVGLEYALSNLRIAKGFLQFGQAEHPEKHKYG